MSLIFDFIIVLVAAIAIIRGISKGFIKSVMSLASIVIAILCVLTFTKPLSAWVGEKYISEPITDIAHEALSGIVNTGAESMSFDKVFEDRPEALVSLAERFSFDLDEISAYYDNALSSLSVEESITGLSEKIAAPIAEGISTVISAIAIFLVSMLVCTIITFILDGVCHLPVLKKLNKILGAVFGIISALLTSWLIANILAGLIIAFGAVHGEIFNESVITDSFILKFFYNNNLIFIK